MEIDQNIPQRSPARKLVGTFAIALAVGACAIGIGPSATRSSVASAGGAAFSAASTAGARSAYRADDDGFTVNDTSGDAASDDAQFAVGSLALSDAETIAIHYWGVLPCSGVVNVSWQSLDPSINGVASWWNPVDAYSDPVANAQCSITLNTAQDFSWPMLCTVVTHEFGHLTGHQHVTDPTDVMYPVYVGPISQCLAPPIGVPAPVTASAPAASTGHATATTASHKAKKKAKKKTAKKKSTKKAKATK